MDRILFFRNRIRNGIAAGSMAINGFSILMDFVQIKYMIAWGFHHLFAICQNHRLQDVDGLCDICHVHSLGMFMENIQGDRCDHGITDRILLV